MIFSSFLRLLSQKAVDVGMHIDGPKDERIITEDGIESYFKMCSDNGIKFILFISPDDGGSHSKSFCLCKYDDSI